MSIVHEGRARRESFAVVRQWVTTQDWAAWAALGLPLALYLATMAPTFYGLDSAELTTAVATGGIVRATGYPLYLLVGRIWLALLPPVGDVGFRMNLMSAVAGALTIFLADRILRRLRVGPWPRAGALGLLACAPAFWSMSIVAEVYTLHCALMAATILLLMRWAETPTPRRLLPPALLVGLSLGNHASTVLLLPGYLWFVLAHQPRVMRSARAWLVGLVAVLTACAIYLVLPLYYRAGPAFNYAGLYDGTGRFVPVDLTSAAGLWWLVSGERFRGMMFGYAAFELPAQVSAFARALWTAFFAIGVGPALVGVLVLWRRDWRFASTWTLLFLGNAVFFVNYRVVDKETMFLPAFVLWAIALGVGYQWLVGYLQRQDLGAEARRLAQAVMVGAVVLAVGWHWHSVDLSDDWSSRQEAEAILQQVAPDALVLGRWQTIPALQYLQLVEGQRPDVTLINRFLISYGDMRQVILAELGRRPVYVDDILAGLPPAVTGSDEGSLVRLRLIGSTPPIQEGAEWGRRW